MTINNQAFQKGDLVGLDIGMEYHGFFTDMATTVAVEPAATVAAAEALVVAIATNYPYFSKGC